MVDLGSGAGFDVFQAAKKVGREGRVWGVDMNDVSIQAVSLPPDSALERESVAERGKEGARLGCGACS